MTESTPTAENRRPPEWLFKRVINPAMKTILRSPLHRMLSNGLMILTFTGRKSGKQFSTPVAYHMLDAKTVMVTTRSPWWKNLRGGTPITLRLKGNVYSGKPEVIEDNEIVWGYISTFLKQTGNPRSIGVMLPPDSSPEAIRQAASDLVGIKITLN